MERCVVGALQHWQGWQLGGRRQRGALLAVGEADQPPGRAQQGWPGSAPNHAPGLGPRRLGQPAELSDARLKWRLRGAACGCEASGPEGQRGWLCFEPDSALHCALLCTQQWVWLMPNNPFARLRLGPARRGCGSVCQAAEQHRGCCEAGRLCEGACVVVCSLCAGVAPVGHRCFAGMFAVQLAEGREGRVLGVRLRLLAGVGARAGT